MILADNLFSKPFIPVDHVNVKNLTEYDFEDNINNYDEDLKNYLNEITSEEKKFRIVSCLVLFRNMINKTPNKVVDTVSSSKHDKKKSFIKIYAESMLNCVETITEDVCDKVLNEKNILIEDSSLANRYLKFDTARFQIIGPEPNLTPRETELFNEMEEYSAPETIKKTNIEEDFRISEISLTKGRGFYLALGFSVGLIIVLGRKFLKN